MFLDVRLLFTVCCFPLMDLFSSYIKSRGPICFDPWVLFNDLGSRVITPVFQITGKSS